MLVASIIIVNIQGSQHYRTYNKRHSVRPIVNTMLRTLNIDNNIDRLNGP